MIPVELGIGVVVFAMAFLVTGRLCVSQSRTSIIDYPNDRSLHVTPTPRTGGVAILGSFLAGFIMWALFNLSEWWPVLVWRPHEHKTGMWIILTVLLIGGVSFWDDRRGVSILVRFATHLLGALGLTWGAGLVVEHFPIPSVTLVQLGGVSLLGSIGYVMWMTNLFNFMDGMDGFAGGMAVIGFAGLAFLGWERDHQTLMLLSMFICLATIGFLLFNYPPAKIFMGDVGSASLGFLAGALSLLGVRDGIFDIWVPLLLFSPFLADATVTLIRRAANKKPVWRAHREHYYQRLVLAGWGHKKTVLAEYGLMLGSGMSAIAYGRVQESFQLAILLFWGLVYILLHFFVRGVERHPHHVRV